MHLHTHKRKIRIVEDIKLFETASNSGTQKKRENPLLPVF